MDERNKGQITRPAAAYSRQIAVTEKGTVAILDELAACGVSEVIYYPDGAVTLRYAPAVAAYNAKESTRLRVEKLRDKRRGNEAVWKKEDEWLKIYIQEQEILVLPGGIDLFDPVWWERISLACGGLSTEFLDREFSKIANWIETPGKNPPVEKQRNGLPNTGGWKNFIGNWLVRAYERQRRYGG